MDQRQTFSNNHELIASIEALQRDAAKASLLIDIDGLERLEGMITGITQNDDPSETVITIDGKQEVKLDNVIAVNGVFRSDYSEC